MGTFWVLGSNIAAIFTFVIVEVIFCYGMQAKGVTFSEVDYGFAVALVFVGSLLGQVLARWSRNFTMMDVLGFLMFIAVVNYSWTHYSFDSVIMFSTRYLIPVLIGGFFTYTLYSIIYTRNNNNQGRQE